MNWFSWSTLLASSTPDVQVMATYLFPLILIPFVATAAIIGIRVIINVIQWIGYKIGESTNGTFDKGGKWRKKTYKEWNDTDPMYR